MVFPCGPAGKESACNAGDLGSMPRLERSHGEGKGYPLQYSGLENSMDCIVHGVIKSWTWLSDSFHFTQPFNATWVLLCLTFATLWTVDSQAPLFMGFSRQEYWSGFSFPSPRDLPNPRIEPQSLKLPALADRFFTNSATWEAPQFSSVQFSSVTQLCPPLCDPMNCSTPGLPVHHQLPEFTQTHVH